MKAPDVFIIIPATTTDTYYIKPYDIVSLVEYKSGEVAVSYKVGAGINSFNTLLTAQEIHERIIELEAQSITFTFGEDNG